MDRRLTITIVFPLYEASIRRQAREHGVTATPMLRRLLQEALENALRRAGLTPPNAKVEIAVNSIT
jgi:hypothetical protein